MTGRRFTLLVLIVGAVAAAGVLALTAFAATSPTGVRGLVKLAPPGNCPADDPCDGIGRHIELVFTRTGKPAHRVRSNDQGAFSIRLAPGRYQAASGTAPVRPATITVPAKGYSRVVLVVGQPKTMLPPPAP